MILFSLIAAIALAQASAEVQPVPPPPPPPPEETVDADGNDAGVSVDVKSTPVQTVPDATQYAVQPAIQPAVQEPAYSPPAYPQAALSDRRIQLLSYEPDQIVTLSVSPGFASVVELNEDERVENVVVGNSAGWQVTANRRGDRVIVKPLAGASQSNLILLTGSRRYVFVLDPFGESSFIMRFRYPQAVPAALTVASAGETGYRFRGNKGLYPLAMSDDGRRTVIRWSEQNVLPAIYALNGRKEELVNGRMVGTDYVIEGAAPRYRFRYGKAEATAIRTVAKRRR